MEGMKDMEVEFVAAEVLVAAREAIDRMFEEHSTDMLAPLSLGYGGDNPMYVASDAEKLVVPVSSLTYHGHQFFLGYMHE